MPMNVSVHTLSPVSGGGDGSTISAMSSRPTSWTASVE
jgi:hypothetical protein